MALAEFQIGTEATNKILFVPSTKISVYPCAHRGTSETTEDGVSIVFDPESRLNTERNITRAGHLNRPYIISSDDSELKLNLLGYEVTIRELPADKKDLSVYLLLKTTNLMESTVEGEENHSTTGIASFYSDDSINLGEFTLDQKFADGNYYFTGLCLVGTAAAKTALTNLIAGEGNLSLVKLDIYYSTGNLRTDNFFSISAAEVKNSSSSSPISTTFNTTYLTTTNVRATKSTLETADITTANIEEANIEEANIEAINISTPGSSVITTIVEDKITTPEVETDKITGKNIVASNYMQTPEILGSYVTGKLEVSADEKIALNTGDDIGVQLNNTESDKSLRLSNGFSSIELSNNSTDDYDIQLMPAYGKISIDNGAHGTTISGGLSFADEVYFNGDVSLPSNTTLNGKPLKTGATKDINITSNKITVGNGSIEFRESNGILNIIINNEE